MIQLQESGTLTVAYQIVVVKTIRMICSGTKGILMEETQSVVSRVVHCFVEVISTALSHNIPTSSILYNECIVGLCTMGVQLGPRFIIFDDLIWRTIQNHGINVSKYEELSRALRSGSLPEFGYGDWEVFQSDSLGYSQNDDIFAVGSER